jgi:D-alanine-D-alanine ligase
VAQETSSLPRGIVTHRQKRLLDGGRERLVLPAGRLAERIETYTRRLCDAVKEFDYLRVDFRLDPNTGRLYLLEFNIGCNLGSHAAVMFAARHAGLEQAEVIEHILRHSLDRQQRLWPSVTGGGPRHPRSPASSGESPSEGG